MIYADNAATSKLCEFAFDKMKNYMVEDYSNPSQPYSFSRASKKAIKDARESIATSINADPSEIYFTSGGSESDNWAIKGFGDSKSQKVVITSCIEHHAITNACKSEERKGSKYIKIPVDGLGTIDLTELENNLKINQSAQVLVSIVFANNEIGTIEPIKAIAELSHRYGAVVHTDAVQAVGHLKINVKDLGVDMLSASAHKFNGPKGIGFLFVKKGIKIDSLIDGGSQENGMRAGTENVASIVGMAAALKESSSLIDENTSKLLSFEQELFRVLETEKVDYIRNGNENCRLPGLISISIKNADGEMILHRLDLMGICISTGSACDGVKTQVSDVIKAICVPDEYNKGTIRISFGRYNELSDATEIATAIAKILK